MGDEDFRATLEQILALQQVDRRENQLLLYKPVSEKSKLVHSTEAKVIAVGGGNGSSKTETCLVHMIALMTGVLPQSVRELLRPKFRGPINCRAVIESLTTTLHPVILPKLVWNKWTGVDRPGGDRGHWGWVPKMCLIDGSWERSWSEKTRVLRVLCRDPDNLDRVIGESTLQFMSHDQDPSDFASGDFHIVLHDEPPGYAIWRENQARTMRVNGVMMLAMTWPDDPSIPVDWIFDEVYERAVPGPNKRPEYEWINLYTTDNPHLNQEAIRVQMAAWSEETKKVRIFGQPIRFSNRIHPLFTDTTDGWCYTCVKPTFIENGTCSCPKLSSEVGQFCHVKTFQVPPNWPVVFVLDPHPRKPHMFLWAAVDPADDIWVVADGQALLDPVGTRELVEEKERELGLNVRVRLMDPNMGATVATAKRTNTWQDEFADAGLYCDLADDSDVGRGRVNEYLMPDRFRLAPRLHIHERCTATIHQLKRFVWDEWKGSVDKDKKQTAKEKNDDYPACLRYLMNYYPTYNTLKHGPQIIGRRGLRSAGP